LSNWLQAMRKLDAWVDPDGAIGLLPQLEAALERPPNTVILNALDRFSPYPDASSLVVSFPDDAVAGLRLLGDLLGVRQPIIAMSKSVPPPGRLRNDCRRNKTRIESIVNRYPTSDSTLVAHLIASGKRRLRPHTNPVAQGVLLVRPWSAIRLGRWLARKRFDTVRPMLLAWPEPGVRLSVRYAWPGQPLLSVHERLASAARTTPNRILFGHPMTGRCAIIDAPTDDPEDLTVPDHESLITLLGMDSAPPRAPELCISCGWCAHVCPTRLRPADLWRLCRRGGPADVLINDLSWCIDCGLCTHVCPSALPLAQSFRQMSERFGRIGGLSDGT
jgi:electron transport complex protein RnfC